MNSEGKGKIFSGIAGEYFVAGELSRRGYIASVTLRNTEGIDIIASNGEKTANIQVKTRRTDKMEGWNLGGKPLGSKREWDNIFYVLVEISSDPAEKIVNYYVIPKNELNRRVDVIFEKWREGKNLITGKPRRSEVRMFKIKEHPDFRIDEYKDNWDKLF